MWMLLKHMKGFSGGSHYKLGDGYGDYTLKGLINQINITSHRI